MESISKTELAYIAGFFDGEGNVGLYHRNKNSNTLTLSVALYNTNPIPLMRCKELFGGCICSQKSQAATEHDWRTEWAWRATTKKAEHFLRQVFKYLIIKKEEAAIALESRKISSRRGQTGPWADTSKQKTEMANQLKALKRLTWATLPM